MNPEKRFCLLARQCLVALLVGLAGACAPTVSRPDAPPAVPADMDEAPFRVYASRNRADVSGQRGAVVADHPLAAAAGYDVLRRGGNAVDAVVTMAAVLAVVRPLHNGVGGDAFGLIYRADTRAVHGLNGSGRAGALATPTFFEERGIRSIPGQGALSVTVPGAVSAWAAALERFGTISLAEALEPAIHYAEEGFVVSAILAADLRDKAARLNEAGREIFTRHGAPVEGSTLRNPALARALRRLAAEGPSALYGGPIGEALARFVETEGGYLRAADFATHRPDWEDPISVEHDGKRIYGMPPSTSGLSLLQQIALGAHFPLRSMEHNGADYLHTMVEVKKVAFADRGRWIADPEFVPSRAAQLLEPSYIAGRAQLVGERAAASVVPGLGAAAVAPVGAGEDNTVYLMAVDPWGNAVSWIQSLFSEFGSALVEPTTGVVLQNRGGQFTLDLDHPNVIAPGKRPFHTLTPHLVTQLDGRLAMTLGTPGGDSQPQSLFQVFNNIYMFGMSPQQAVEAPRFRSFAGRRLAIESRIRPDVRAELTRRGHQLTVVDGWTTSFGGVQIIQIDPASGALRTGADPRREGYAIAY